MSFYKNINNLDERRLFAAMAMEGMLARCGTHQSDYIIRNAVMLADALITELNKTKMAVCKICNEQPLNIPTAALCDKCAREFKFK